MAASAVNCTFSQMHGMQLPTAASNKVQSPESGDQSPDHNESSWLLSEAGFGHFIRRVENDNKDARLNCHFELWSWRIKIGLVFLV